MIINLLFLNKIIIKFYSQNYATHGNNTIVSVLYNSSLFRFILDSLYQNLFGVQVKYLYSYLECKQNNHNHNPTSNSRTIIMVYLGFNLL